MQTYRWYRSHLVTAIASCAIGLLFAACSSAEHEVEAISYSCAAPPADLDGCAVDSDCTTVAIGCYCGAQPVNGVARKYSATARSCEDSAASACALGCATEPGMLTQDGGKASTGTNLAARCDRASHLCKSYVPPPGGGSGDPSNGGW